MEGKLIVGNPPQVSGVEAPDISRHPDDLPGPLNRTAPENVRIDLEAAIQRGMRRLCATQRRDMPLLISDLLEGYTLDETCERHGWTRNRGVTLMRKLRTVFYEELSGEKKTGYLGSHHPLTEAEKQRIRELYATGLSYKKVGALVGRSPSAVEGVCKQYPPELVAQVRELYAEGLSNAEIAKKLSISPKTVDHHVSAILAKMQVHSRLEAAALARQKNIL